LEEGEIFRSTISNLEFLCSTRVSLIFNVEMDRAKRVHACTDHAAGCRDDAVKCPPSFEVHVSPLRPSSPTTPTTPPTGMRSGTYISALGRQSFEPSAPAPTSSQQANERQRELIKAQNDVLATVGVCLRDGRRDVDKNTDLMAENQAGLIVGAVDITMTYLASWPLVGIRNRLQVGSARGC
jgi:hypothetical protein